MKGEQILKRLKELKNQLPENTTADDLIEKAVEREDLEGLEARKQIGVHMNVTLWWKFKEQAAKEHMSAGQLLEKLVRAYLEAVTEMQN